MSPHSSTDGVLQLSLIYYILTDTLPVIRSWNYHDETSCLWTCATCTELGKPNIPRMMRVRRLVLPNKHLGSVTSDLFLSPHLRILDLSSNLFNGLLPHSVFNAIELQTIFLGIKNLSGHLPQIINIFISPGSESANAVTGESSILIGAAYTNPLFLSFFLCRGY
ncbi:hypothetical protein YC2023_044996 [Brassica napus]